MYLLPGNPFSHAVEAYRDSGDSAMCKPLASPAHPLYSKGLIFFYILGPRPSGFFILGPRPSVDS